MVKRVLLRERIMTLKTAACRFFLISRLYSIGSTIATVLSLTLTCVSAGLATPAGQELTDANTIQYLIVLAHQAFMKAL